MTTMTNCVHFQVVCVFVASKIITIMTQQYFPLYFLSTLKMNEVSRALTESDVNSARS